MKKILAFLLFSCVLLLTIFGYFKFLEYKEENGCLDSEFVANGEPIWVEFDSSFTLMELKNISVEILEKGKIKDEIKIHKIDYYKRYEFSIKTKILKTDTLLIKLKSQEFKIYDFKNGGIRQKAGQNKGVYYCGISELKINSKTDSLHGSNKIYLTK